MFWFTFSTIANALLCAFVIHFSGIWFRNVLAKIRQHKLTEKRSFKHSIDAFYSTFSINFQHNRLHKKSLLASFMLAQFLAWVGWDSLLRLSLSFSLCTKSTYNVKACVHFKQRIEKLVLFGKPINSSMQNNCIFALGWTEKFASDWNVCGLDSLAILHFNRLNSFAYSAALYNSFLFSILNKTALFLAPLSDKTCLL